MDLRLSSAEHPRPELCLDFVNAHDDRQAPASYAGLLAWAVASSAVSEEDGELLDRESVLRSGEAARVALRAADLRQTLSRVFAAVVAGESVHGDDLAALNRHLGAAMSRLCVGSAGGRWVWSWTGPPDDLDRPLWPVVRSAAVLLVSPQADHLRQCASKTCTWLFIDTSRGHRRRWCDMRTCGNREKARRHYERRREALGDAGGGEPAS